ncbi:hypothetical protein BGZ74_011011 [Mortierella antarctica]|nr:hypothetical protein BGZ74_011011 [Mortierella antarctica]
MNTFTSKQALEMSSSPSGNTCPFAKLPGEVLLLVMSLLSPSDLHQCLKVRKTWRSFVYKCRTGASSEFCDACLRRVHNPKLWKRMTKKLAGPILQPQHVPQNHGHRLCLHCRIEFFTEHPEPYPEQFRNVFRTKRDLANKNALHFEWFDMIEYKITQSGVCLYNEVSTILVARKIFGGDVGIAVATL